MSDVNLNENQEALLKAIPQELRRETALAYIANGYSNKTEAYVKACKKMGKKPSKNPAVSASEILNYANVAEFINSIKMECIKATKTDAEYVLRRLREIDELDVIDIVNDDMSGFKPLSEWPKAWRISISGMDMKRMIEAQGEAQIETVIQKIKWPDKTKNLELIGRHVDVKAWDKEADVTVVTKNIMPVPTADSVDDWEDIAKEQQGGMLGGL